MEEKHDSFKDNYEWVAMNQFLPEYNKLYNRAFDPPEHRGDAPDFTLLDSESEDELDVEVTMLTESPRGPLEWKKMLNGTFQRHKRPETYRPEVLNIYCDIIKKKFNMRYGQNCALLAFHWGAPIPWHVDLQYFISMMDFDKSPFLRGVFLVSWGELYRLDQ